LKRTFQQVLDVIADVVLRPTFPAEEVERQRASRLAQLVQQRDSPGPLASRIMVGALYGPKHPYGYTEVGTEASVKAITRDDMLAFWKQSFVPNNAALVVAGNITMAELKPLAERAFGSWQRGTPARPALGTPAGTGARVIIVDKPGAPQTELRVATVGAPRSTPDFQAIQVMNTALGGLFSSRINMNLREQHGYTYGAGSGFVFRRGPGPFVVQTGVRTDVTAPAVREIFKEIRGMAEQPMTADELTKAKDSLARSLPGNFERSDFAAGSFANVFIYDLGLDYFAKYAERVNAVTAEQALAVAKKYLVPEKLVVIAIGDRKAIEPQLKQLNLGAVEIRDAEGRPVTD
jgi:zinc protease